METRDPPLCKEWYARGAARLDQTTQHGIHRVGYPSALGSDCMRAKKC